MKLVHTLLCTLILLQFSKCKQKNLIYNGDFQYIKIQNRWGIIRYDTSIYGWYSSSVIQIAEASNYNPLMQTNILHLLHLSQQCTVKQSLGRLDFKDGYILQFDWAAQQKDRGIQIQLKYSSFRVQWNNKQILFRNAQNYTKNHEFIKIDQFSSQQQNILSFENVEQQYYPFYKIWGVLIDNISLKKYIK